MEFLALNPTLYTPEDWAGKLVAGNSSVLQVAQQEKINLLGENPLALQPIGAMLFR
ncbi:hypothetical protein [Pseudomonas sp. FW300-N1A1]|uniref:hypothetical protein n=1 Tax=Pseudomonas sp. FW300-N1A1 TaxID=2075555 RepID=UPI0013049A34|nr:hypothetical protein [Pseudomonas sp. FW300-N1A1]